ncbi:MAG TPA: RNA polymerase sigma factor RpoH, partial [Methylophilaceae bacterium]|nr:RNA polymerase sigma factor RpoH [Methylophilaceae bacterium]
EEIQNIAKELKVKPEEVMEMEYRLNGQEVSLDAHIDDDGEESFSPIAYLEDESPEPAQFLENMQNEQLQSTGLSKALMSL